PFKHYTAELMLAKKLTSVIMVKKKKPKFCDYNQHMVTKNELECLSNMVCGWLNKTWASQI
ncbi:hypothetical protein ACQP3L_40160, partial [Escherichia coli]